MYTCTADTVYDTHYCVCNACVYVWVYLVCLYMICVCMCVTVYNVINVCAH